MDPRAHLDDSSALDETIEPSSADRAIRGRGAVTPIDGSGEVTPIERSRGATPVGRSLGETSPSHAFDDTVDSPSRLHHVYDGPTPGRIGRFEVRERLGAGGMGVVFAAHDPMLDRPVAIKLIRAEASDEHDSAGTSRLLREAQALAKLSHPNVVSVYEVGSVDDQVYLVMELVRGLDLGRWLAKERRPWDQVLQIYCEAGRGLAAAHAAGLVHRDFKPSNAILGADGRVRVLDFGLARARLRPAQARDDDPPPSASGSLDLRLTRTGAVLGTPAFMAPEQFLGHEIDAATDQFSFCVALYAALFGEPPFPGATYLALSEAVCAGQVRTPLPGPVPDHVVRALLRGLSVDPAARWRSMELLLAELTHPESTADAGAAIFGHRGPQGRLRQRLAALRRGRGGVVILEGEPGLGKSLLGRTLADEAAAAGVRVLRGGAAGQALAAAYHAWRDVVVDALGLAGVDDLGERDARVLALLESLGLRDELAPLLGDVIPLGVGESPFTRQLDPTVRADNRQRLLVELLHRRLAGAPALLLLEDAHWFDTASWALALAVARLAAEGALLLVLTARPDEAPPPARRELEASAHTEHLRLGTLSPEDTAALLGARLGLSPVPEALAQRAHAWTHGTPFFIEQLALALQEAGLVQSTSRGVAWIAGEAELAAFQVPSSVEALISRRLDRLADDDLAALRLAAVIGRPFTGAELSALLALAAPAVDVHAALAALLGAGLLVRAPAGALNFPHALARQATYESIAPDERRRLHQVLATWYEEHVRKDSSDRLAALAHHWRRAEVLDKAVTYLGRAGEQAFQAFASREAVDLLGDALARGDALATPLPPAQRARWHRLLGEAHVKLGEYHAARHHLSRALRHLGHPTPGAAFTAVLGVVGHLTQQGLRRLLPAGLLRGRGEAAERARDASRIHQALSEIAFFEQDTLGLTHATLAGLNLAERSGAPRELAFTYSTAAILFGVLDLHRVARSYVERARIAADRDGSEGTIAYTTLLRAVYAQSVPIVEWMDRDIPAAVTSFAALGDRPRVHITLANDAFLRLILEDLAGAERGAAALDSQLDDASAQVRNFALVQNLVLDLARGAPDLARLDRLEGLLQRNRLAHGDTILGEGVAAACRLRRGESSHALALAERVTARLAYKTPTTLYTSFGIRGVIDVLLAIDPHGARKAIERAQRALRQIAFHNPAVRPCSALVDAQLAAAYQAPSTALRLARRAAALARAAGVRRSEAHALQLQARLLADGDAQRGALLDAAARHFEAAGDTHGLAQLRRALGPG